MILNSTESRSLWRTYVMTTIMAIGLLLLLVALAYREISQGDFWTEQMAQSSTRAVKLPAPRGLILDRNRTVLVDNRPSYNVALYLDEFNAGRSTKKLLKIVHTSIETMKDRMKMPIKVNDNTILRHYDQRGPLPLTVWNDLSPAALAAFEERSPWMQGVDLQIEPVRVYPFGPLACHVLGYVGKPESSKEEEEDFDSMGRKAFSQPDLVGKSGIEASMDKVLQGTSGQRVIKLSAAGMKEAEVSNFEPTPGNNIILSIDKDIQAIVEETFVGYRGACVVMDPNNGDILAMASAPTFNPNLFIPAIKSSDWNELQNDKQKPLLNRAVQGGYAPGSTFKVITTLAGLEKGTITPEEKVECLGRFFLGNLSFGCWNKGGHGDMNLKDAITMSCDVYFYTMGMRMGGPAMWSMSSAFGLGERTGVPLDHEETGILPTEEWKKKRNPRDRWTTGDSVNMSIGQGALLVTPLQMAVVSSTIANGGIVYKPRLVLRVESSDGDTLMDFPPETRGLLPASPAHLQILKEAMLNVVENGTGKSAALEKIKIAGKTGSAQFTGFDPHSGKITKQTRAWMISFAPYFQPRYSIIVLAEGTVDESGGHTAGPFIGTIYKKIFQLEEARKEQKPPPAVAAVPISEKIAGFEGDVSGELMDDNNNSPPSSQTTDQSEDEEEPPPKSFPAEKVTIP